MVFWLLPINIVNDMKALLKCFIPQVKQCEVDHYQVYVLRCIQNLTHHTVCICVYTNL